MNTDRILNYDKKSYTNSINCNSVIFKNYLISVFYLSKPFKVTIKFSTC